MVARSKPLGITKDTIQLLAGTSGLCNTGAVIAILVASALSPLMKLNSGRNALLPSGLEPAANFHGCQQVFVVASNFDAIQFFEGFIA